MPGERSLISSITSSRRRWRCCEECCNLLLRCIQTHTRGNTVCGFYCSACVCHADVSIDPHALNNYTQIQLCAGKCLHDRHAERTDYGPVLQPEKWLQKWYQSHWITTSITWFVAVDSYKIHLFLISRRI